MRQLGQIYLPWVIPPSAIKIKAFLPRIIVCRRVHVTRLAHGLRGLFAKRSGITTLLKAMRRLTPRLINALNSAG